MASVEGARASYDDLDFEHFFLDLTPHVRLQGTGSGFPSIALSPSFDGSRLLERYATGWGVRRWTPLTLAQALVDFKGRIGGSARVVAVAPDLIEIAQTRCEFGEPRDNECRGNLCDLCRGVASSITRASGLAGPTQVPRSKGTMAQGYKFCDFSFPLV